MRVMSVFGTRPEAIKMAPVVKALEAADGIESIVCLTGQHREMLEQVVRLFGIEADTNLEIMSRAKGLSEITNAILNGMDRVLEQFRPDWILVHGDTTTTMASAMAAFYRQVPVGHVEAGLRTGNMLSPWPEEMNRKVAGVLSSLHFAPTATAEANLMREGVARDRIAVTGNTVIDALYWVRDNALADAGDEIAARFPFLDPAKRMILVTGHRRENQDGGIARICMAMREIAARGDVQVVYPVHLNPAVKDSVEAVLSGVKDVHLIAPADYLPFVWLMNRSSVIVTDSGGIQEEAPSLGKPVLVARDTTERPEAVESGVVKLIGTDADAIAVEVARLLDDSTAYETMAQAQNPYGDGNASARIVGRLLEEA